MPIDYTKSNDEMKKFKSRKNIAEFERKAVVEEEAGHLFGERVVKYNKY